jgi:hypothetical protein
MNFIRIARQKHNFCSFVLTLIMIDSHKDMGKSLKKKRSKKGSEVRRAKAKPYARKSSDGTIIDTPMALAENKFEAMKHATQPDTVGK